MSVYARRRIAALVVVLVVVVGGYLLFAGGGGSSKPKAAPKVVPPTSAGRPGGKELASILPTGRVPLPTTTKGVGPFLKADGKVVRRQSATPGNMVALTFDDGPGPYTEGILEALQHEHAHATFFVLGSLAHDNPDMVRELYAAGMQIGNHTWTHPQLARLGASKQQSELERTQVQIAKIIGVRPRFYRPPYWSWNDLTIREGGELGMIGVLFSVDTDDWERPGTEAIINSALKAQAGDVIAFHDAGGDRSQTVDAVASIVVGLRKRGLEPVTLDKLYGDAPE
jgi:peptidoglycan/xylan/chitin deacetylase (PgdA/CDA1 family)